VCVVSGCGRFGFESDQAGIGQLDAASDTVVADASADLVLCYSAFDGPIYVDDVVNSANLAAIQLRFDQALRIRRLETFTGEVTGQSTLGIRDHDLSANLPGAERTSAQFGIVPAIGWQGVDLPIAVDIPADTPFWFTLVPANNAQAPIETNSGGASTDPAAQLYRVFFNDAWNGPFREAWKLRVWCE